MYRNRFLMMNVFSVQQMKHNQIKWKTGQPYDNKYILLIFLTHSSRKPGSVSWGNMSELGMGVCCHEPLARKSGAGIAMKYC